MSMEFDGKHRFQFDRWQCQVLCYLLLFYFFIKKGKLELFACRRINEHAKKKLFFNTQLTIFVSPKDAINLCTTHPRCLIQICGLVEHAIWTEWCIRTLLQSKQVNLKPNLIKGWIGIKMPPLVSYECLEE